MTDPNPDIKAQDWHKTPGGTAFIDICLCGLPTEALIQESSAPWLPGAEPEDEGDAPKLLETQAQQARASSSRESNGHPP